MPNHDPNIDPNDDSLDRWIVWHYRYDPERRERRNVVVACFDNRRVFMKFMERSNAELELAKLDGRADKKEHISGVVWDAGCREEMRLQRLGMGKNQLVQVKTRNFPNLRLWGRFNN